MHKDLNSSENRCPQVVTTNTLASRSHPLQVVRCVKPFTLSWLTPIAAVWGLQVQCVLPVCSLSFTWCTLSKYLDNNETIKTSHLTSYHFAHNSLFSQKRIYLLAMVSLNRPHFRGSTFMISTLETRLIINLTKSHLFFSTTENWYAPSYAIILTLFTIL